MYNPDCENCQHIKECDLRQSLKELRETIFNINREKSGRYDCWLDWLKQEVTE